jgi:hypothetical protein
MRIWKGFVVGLSIILWCSMCLRRRWDRGVVISVVFSDSVGNLGLYIDNPLSWREQVSRVFSRTYSSLGLLHRFQRYTSRDLRIYLVRSLIIPIFLYTDVVYFLSLTGLEFRRLELALFGLRCIDHISLTSLNFIWLFFRLNVKNRTI